MPVKMTPLAFAQKFLSLEVFLYPQELSSQAKATTPYTPPTDWQQFSADKYRLGLSSWPSTFWGQSISQHFRGSVNVKIKTIDDEVIEYENFGMEMARSHFGYPFSGKGSPEDVQLALQLVYRFHPAKTPIDVFLTKDFVGTDCNGFVGGYYRRVVLDSSWLSTNPNKDPGPTTLMDDMLRWGTEVHDPSELANDGTYILVWCDGSGVIKKPSKLNPTSYGHVMITEPFTLRGTPGNQRVLVVESTPPKLRAVDYQIQSVRKTSFGHERASVFRVLRGPEQSPMDVRLSRLKITSTPFLLAAFFGE
jgi:hypothetical protein